MTSETVPPEPAEGPAEAPVAEVPLPATFSTAGLAWSECALRSTGFSYKHEWAAALLPAEYQPTNNVAGNLGEALVMQLNCEGVAIGNATYVANASLAVFAIKVQAPDGLHAAFPNFYVLDVVSDHPSLVAGFLAAGLPATEAALLQTDSTFGIQGDQVAVRVTEAHARAQEVDGPADLRLHHKVGASLCYVDTHHAVRGSQSTEVLVEGLAGNPRTVAGPLGSATGGGQRGIENGSMSAPACDGAQE